MDRLRAAAGLRGLIAREGGFPVPSPGNGDLCDLDPGPLQLRLSGSPPGAAFKAMAAAGRRRGGAEHAMPSGSRRSTPPRRCAETPRSEWRRRADRPRSHCALHWPRTAPAVRPRCRYASQTSAATIASATTPSSESASIQMIRTRPPPTRLQVARLPSGRPRRLHPSVLAGARSPVCRFFATQAPSRTWNEGAKPVLSERE